MVCSPINLRVGIHENMIITEPDPSSTLYLDQVEVQSLLLSKLSVSEILVYVFVKGKL